MEEIEFERVKRGMVDILKSVEDIDVVTAFLADMKIAILTKGLECSGCHQFVSHDEVSITPYVNKRTQRKVYCKECTRKVEDGYERVCDCGTVFTSYSPERRENCSDCNSKWRVRTCLFCGNVTHQYYHYYNAVFDVSCDTFICHECFDQRKLTNMQIEAERLKLRAHIHRTQSLSLPSNLTLPEWLNTLDRFQWSCAYCQGAYQHFEHFICVERGGGTTKGNCIPSCSSCNRHKQRKLPEEITFVSTEVIVNIQSYLNQFS